jgi:hypothetical protein
LFKGQFKIDGGNNSRGKKGRANTRGNSSEHESLRKADIKRNGIINCGIRKVWIIFKRD